MVKEAHLAVNVGNPGDMVQGNAFKKFSSDFARNFICNLISEAKREQFGEILLGLFTLVKGINSSVFQNAQTSKDLRGQLAKYVVIHN